MALKKASLHVTTTPPSAADFFTRGKKPTTTERVITTKKATLFKTTPASKNSNNISNSINNHINNNKPKTEKQQRGQDQSKLFQGITSTSHAVIVISDSEGDDDEANGNYGASTTYGFGDDLGPLDDILSDDPFGSQKLRSEPLLQTNSKEVVDEPLINPLVPRASSVKQFLIATPSVGIKHGIHQEHISEQEKILRQFDLASKYGPCLDMTRLERWERASQLGLSPPMDVKDMLAKDVVLNTSLFAGRV
ncbi:hypothetical protein BGZ96_007037 [Linnemannia gamsii]|uniref:DNA polymerase delta subunit 4 n=1 Tax=Linnemannia gamsii TaxID=64522 RepID=A0ABQ7KFQ8_9FUNG|nr:hypothetical protein BGZ96_007037 [Linnemannia gamsii]